MTDFLTRHAEYKAFLGSKAYNTADQRAMWHALREAARREGYTLNPDATYSRAEWEN